MFKILISFTMVLLFYEARADFLFGNDLRKETSFQGIQVKSVVLEPTYTFVKNYTDPSYQTDYVETLYNDHSQSFSYRQKTCIARQLHELKGVFINNSKISAAFKKLGFTEIQLQLFDLKNRSTPPLIKVPQLVLAGSPGSESSENNKTVPAYLSFSINFQGRCQILDRKEIKSQLLAITIPNPSAIHVIQRTVEHKDVGESDDKYVLSETLATYKSIPLYLPVIVNDQVKVEWVGANGMIRAYPKLNQLLPYSLIEDIYVSQFRVIGENLHAIMTHDFYRIGLKNPHRVTLSQAPIIFKLNTDYTFEITLGPKKFRLKLVYLKKTLGQ